MEQIKLKLLSREPHMSQILTGFTMLARQGKLKLDIEDHSQDEAQPYRSVMAVVSYRGKTLIYDTLDGYQHEDAIRYHLDHCDFYFKRSFSEEKNRALGLNWQEKMFPLGFNYHVSCPNHPIDRPFWKEEIKRLLGIEHNMYSCTYFSSGRFEQVPKMHKIPQVLFLTRLWYEDPQLPPYLLEERKKINTMRIEIIRQLRAMEGEIHFVGGLPDTDLAQKMAPDLIMPPNLTDRRNYLKCLSKSDICIGTMGLFESIGWKTGEYVASAKAIVNERLHYSVPGDFKNGTNYLEFETADQCIEAVRMLVDDPEKVMGMKQANRAYYQRYLRPDMVIRNSLEIVCGAYTVEEQNNDNVLGGGTPLISIIVPVYKVEKYIHRCVDSILGQTFSDFELILVDDGSPDNCGAICDEYAEKDSRVRVIHQENQGLSAVRNNAVKVARGEWVLFVDSDDLIHSQMVEHMYRAIQESGAGICVCFVTEAENIPDDFHQLRSGGYKAWEYSQEQIEKLYKTGKQKYWIGCAKLVRKEIMQMLPFKVGRIHEDNAVVFKWFHAAGVVAEMEEPYYFYWVNPVGITKSQFNLKKLDLLWALEEQIKFYDSIGYEQMKRNLCTNYLGTAAWYSSRVRNELNNYQKAAEIRRQMRRLIQENPLETLPMTEEERKNVLRAFHPAWEQMKRLPKVVAQTVGSGGISELAKRVIRKFKKY